MTAKNLNPNSSAALPRRRGFPGGARYTLSPRVMELIWLERLRQQALLKEGKFTFNCATAGIDPNKKLRVCTEEIGEMAEAIEIIENLPMKGDVKSSEDLFKQLREAKTHLRDEIVQLAACCVAWLESLEVER